MSEPGDDSPAYRRRAGEAPPDVELIRVVGRLMAEVAELQSLLVERMGTAAAPNAEDPLRREARPHGGGGEITPAEQRILALLAKGMSNRRISRELGLSERTVKNHVHSILVKLRVHSRTEAALIAQRQEIEGPDPPRREPPEHHRPRRNQ